MKYETPELAALKPAINAIQSLRLAKVSGVEDSQFPLRNEVICAYEDWE